MLTKGIGMAAENERGRAIVADADSDTRNLLDRVLSIKGFLSEDAVSPEQLQDKLQRNKVDLALVDAAMLLASDPVLVKKIEASFPDTQLIAFSHTNDNTLAVTWAKRGAGGYICDFCDLEKLNTLLDQVLDKRALRFKIRQF